VYDLGLVIGGSLLVALSAQMALPLPFSPVPITGQTLAVLLVGALLGSRRGSLSLLLYLLEGLAGLPVFAGGTGGSLVLLGPRGGYLLGFVAAAYLTGLLAEKGWTQRFGPSVAAMLLGNTAIYALGLPWLARYVGGMTTRLGLYPYLPGDLLKVFLAAWLLPFGWRFLNCRRTSGV
jgi:biotin transport system substrate-specific component